MKKRIKAPICLGQRMSQSEENRWFLKIESIGLHLIIRPSVLGPGFFWEANIDQKFGLSTGPQAAANAATRWLVRRAELTLHLAGRKPT